MWVQEILIKKKHLSQRFLFKSIQGEELNKCSLQLLKNYE